jgi:hypothetical protein
MRPNYSTTRAPKKRVVFFEKGLRNATENCLMDVTVTYVWISEKILNRNKGAGDGVVLQIEVKISKRNLDLYEAQGEGNVCFVTTF